MQTKSPLARIAGSIAIAAILPLALLLAIVHSGSKPSAQAVSQHSTIAANALKQPTPAQSEKIAAAFGTLPMSFEKNQGQTAAEVRYVSHGPGYELFLTGQEAVVALRQSTNRTSKKLNRTDVLRAQRAVHSNDKLSVIRMKMLDANPTSGVAGLNPLPGKVNYFIGNDPTKWHTDVATYSEVKYSAIYPGIDLVYYGNQKQLEYDFVVAPGADPKQIAFNIDGARKLRIDKRGNLVMTAAAGDVTLQKPFIYQDEAGQRREIAGNYALTGARQVRFRVDAYNHSEPLTIDPAVLIYSTYLGGSGAGGDFGNGIAVDGAGDAWVVGSTTSTDFPVQNGYATTAPAGIAVGSGFVSEISPDGSQFLYSTYLGGTTNGSLGDAAYGVAVDATGRVFVSGVTTSTDFPITATTAYQPNPPASVSNPANSGGAFVTALNPALAGAAQLLYSTFLGGSGSLDESFGVTTDGSGKAYAVGVTLSTDFPVKNPIGSSLNSPAGGAFVTELDTTAASGPASLLFSTYLSGNGGGTATFPYGDSAAAVTIDTNGNVFVAGSTTSTNYPTALGTLTPCGDAGDATAFVSKINVANTPPLGFSACIGGAQGDTLADGIALGPDGGAYITGQTFASDYPVTANTIPYPPTVPNTVERLVFVTKLDTTVAAANKYSTLFGGTLGDVGYGIGIDSSSNVYVSGGTNSPDFPITQGAFQESINNTAGVGFVAKVNPGSNGAADLVYASFFGGSGDGTDPDNVVGLGLTASNAAIITGSTASEPTGANPFPVSSTAKQQTLNGPINAFVAELALVPTIAVSPTSLNFGTQLVGATTAAQFVTVTNNTSAAINLTIPPTFTGANPADFAYSASPTTPCGASLAGGASCSVGVTFTPSVAAAESATLDIADSADTAAHPLTVALSGTGTANGAVISVSPSSVAFGGQLLTTTSAPPQVITVTNTGNAPLIIGTVTSSSPIFTETDNCAGQTIAAAGTCSINVVFAPATNTAPGATSATISITSNANGSPTPISLTGTAWDFNLTVPAAAGINRGSTAMFPVAINGLGGYTGSVAVACVAGTSLTSCTVNPSSGAPGGSVTVGFTAASLIVGPDPLRTPPPASLRQVLFVTLAIMLLCMIPIVRRNRTRLGLAAAMSVFFIIAGCSGHTPTTTTSLTITGTSGGVTKSYTTTITIN